MALKIKKRFQELHRQQTDEEYKQLEADILESGRVRDAIVIMQGDVIVDGHHRYKIATKHKLKYSVIVMNFASELDAEKWILRNQLARRNLTPHEYKIALGRLYNDEKKGHGGDRKPSAQNGNLNRRTAEKLGEEVGQGQATVRRAGKRAEAYDKLAKAARILIDEKPSRASDKAVIALANKSTNEQQALARSVRTGQKPTFDSAMKLPKSKPRKTTNRNTASEQPIASSVTCTRCGGKGKLEIDGQMPEVLALSDEFVNTWQDFLMYRLEKKQKLTTVGIGRLFKKLGEFGAAKAIRALELTMENGWSGVFDPDEKKGKPKKSMHLTPEQANI